MLPVDRLKHVQGLMQYELESCLAAYQAHTPPHLYDAVSYALLLPGKRLRAYLVFECARLFDIAEQDVLAIALSVECMHCYSLIHDDLPCMDDSPLRRGQMTLHVKYDEATALLAGTALLAIAIDLLNKAQAFDFQQRSELIAMLINCSGMQGMMGGQMLDIVGEGRQYNLNQIQHMQQLKTGCLIKFSILAPIMHSSHAQAHLQVLTAYANNLGLAYQIADDLADIESNQASMGKPINQDSTLLKSTFVSILGAQGARTELLSLIDQIETHLQIFENKALSLLWVAQQLINR